MMYGYVIQPKKLQAGFVLVLLEQEWLAVVRM
jgi:hypothetical protein